MDKQSKSVPLTEDQRSALQAICRRRKVDALVWKRARAFLLLDAGYDAQIICEILDIGPTVLTQWRFSFAGMGLSFFGLKDYKQRQGHLSLEQERATQAHFTEHPARSADEMVVFSDAVHPEHQSRPAHGWFPKGQKTALKATSGRKRLNIQGALDLESFQFTFVESEKIKAHTTQQILETLEVKNPTMTAIHVFLDNARYHHVKVLQSWLESSERRVKLHFLPPYAVASKPDRTSLGRHA